MNATHVDPAHYAYRVFWSAEAAEFAAVCRELPGLSWLDETPDAALAGLQRVVADVVIDLRANGGHVPEPLS
jgi:hypothetical protein